MATVHTLPPGSAGLVLRGLAGADQAQYFAVTFVPLGADPFGYSAAEVRQTVLSSGGGGVGTVAPLLVVGAGTWFLTGDVFSERQRVDRFVDQSRFGPGYVKAPAGKGASAGATATTSSSGARCR